MATLQDDQTRYMKIPSIIRVAETRRLMKSTSLLSETSARVTISIPKPIPDVSAAERA